MPDRYAVIGNPVAHSQSPLIHAEFARATGHDISYTALLAPLGGFREAVARFRDEGGRGLNVTLPFKREAWDLAASLRGYASDAHAVNTIEFAGADVIGHNTDGIGLMADLERNLGFPAGGRRVLLLGAGGAAYGVMQPLLDARPALLVVANRTPDKAARLVLHFGRFRKLAAGGVSAQPWDRLAGMQFDLVINATSAGLSGAMPDLPGDIFATGALAYDVVYGRSTSFLEFARERGVRTADGTGMLVEQAAESFRIWRGVRPQTAPVIAMLKSAL